MHAIRTLGEGEVGWRQLEDVREHFRGRHGARRSGHLNGGQEIMLGELVSSSYETSRHLNVSFPPLRVSVSPPIPSQLLVALFHYASKAINMSYPTP